jgi:hypothetical protein
VQTLGKFLAAICAVLFIISGVLVLILFNIEQKAFSSATYKKAFEDQRLYERTPEILAAALSTSIAPHQGALPFLNTVRVEDWQNIISFLLPPEDLKALSDNALDSTFDYLNRKTDTATVSLLPVKSRLVGESGMNVVLQILHLQPECTVEQLTQMALGFLGGQIALCNPPPEAIQLMTPLIQSQLQGLVSVFPNEVTFIADPRSGTPDDPRWKLSTVRSVITLTPILPALFLFGIVVFAVRNLRDWLIWWGWPLMMTGLISVLIALVGSPLVGWILQLLIRTQVSILIPPVLGASIAETASAAAREILSPVVIEGIVLAIVGLGSVILAVFIGNRPNNNPLQRVEYPRV